MKWWRRKQKSLRQELTEARDNVQRQLDILAGGPTANYGWQPGMADKLRTTLADLDNQIAELGPDNARPDLQ